MIPYKTGTKLMVFVILLGYSESEYQRPCNDLTPPCLKKSLQLAIPKFVEGYPEYGLETLDPYYIDKLELAMPGDMVIYFTDGVAKGLKNCIVDYARLQGNVFEVQYHCNLSIKGKYRSKGRMLMFPVDGAGDSTIRCRNLRINSALHLRSKVGGDGQRYLDIKSYNVSHHYDGRVSYSMTNLFKGSPEISNVVLEFMNNNWRMIAEEFGAPMVDFGVACVMRNLIRLMNIIPLDRIITVPVDF